VESISTIPFPDRTGCVKIPQWGQLSYNHMMACLVSIFGNLQGTQDQLNENPCFCLRRPVDIIFNVQYHEIMQTGILIARKSHSVSLVRYMYNWHNHCSGRKLILRIPPAITIVRVTGNAVPFRVYKASSFKLRSAWNARYAKRKSIHLKSFLYYNVLKIGQWCSIPLSSPSPKWSWESSCRWVSADWNHSIQIMSSLPSRCWSIHSFAC